MDENEFRQLLDLFPVVRSPPDYQAGSDFSRQSSGSAPSLEVKEWQDAWSTDDKNGITVQSVYIAARRIVNPRTT